jgi:hypothetical protein
MAYLLRVRWGECSRSARRGKALSSDTNEQPTSNPRPNTGVVSDANAAILRQMTIVERLEGMARINARVRAMLASAVRNRHPAWTEEQVRLEVARKILHEELEDIPLGTLYFDTERDLLPD